MRCGVQQDFGDLWLASPSKIGTEAEHHDTVSWSVADTLMDARPPLYSTWSAQSNLQRPGFRGRGVAHAWAGCSTRIECVPRDVRRLGPFGSSGVSKAYHRNCSRSAPFLAGRRSHGHDDRAPARKDDAKRM